MVLFHRLVTVFMVIERQRRGQAFLGMTPVARPSGYLQQEPHFPSVHLAQAEQVLLQHFPQAPSAAVAAASPSPAMTASRAPALISVFMVCVVLVTDGNHSCPERDSPQNPKSP